MDVPLFQLGLSFLAGMALGLLNFGGLWLTVRRLPHTKHAALLAIGSWLARLLITLTGFYFVMNGEWRYMAACLPGFLLSRMLLSRMLTEPMKEEARAGSGN